MVKNTTGGSKAKGMASKHFKARSKVLRVIQEDGELYGVITDKLGGGHAIVACMDNKSRMIVIGKKFRNERIAKNQMVMVGLREWQTKIQDSEKLEKCDLLEVYNDIESDNLLHKYGPTSTQMVHLVSKLASGTVSYASDDVLFTDDVIDNTSAAVNTQLDTIREIQDSSLSGIVNDVSDADWFESI